MSPRAAKAAAAKVKYDKCPECKHELPPCPLGHEVHCRKIGCACKGCIARILA